MAKKDSAMDKLVQMGISSHAVVERVRVSVRPESLVAADKLGRKLEKDGWRVKTETGRAYADDALLVVYELERDIPQDA